MVGLHILRERCRLEAEGYVQVFRRLTECGVLTVETGEGMARLARLRNLIVHRYWEVDDIRVYTEVRREGLSLVRRFIGEVKAYVSRA